jgi:hypothetical protein
MNGGPAQKRRPQGQRARLVIGGRFGIADSGRRIGRRL